jgi:DNA-binding transcriptional ArsR family regulator
MPSVTKTSQHADVDVFTAIAHPIRRQLLDLLSHRDLTVHGLATQFTISRPAISQHLAVLRAVGLVSLTERGRENYYHLEPEGLKQIAQWVAHYERFWLGKLDALEGYLKRKEQTDDET